jgi:hypothetical protein
MCSVIESLCNFGTVVVVDLGIVVVVVDLGIVVVVVDLGIVVVVVETATAPCSVNVTVLPSGLVNVMSDVAPAAAGVVVTSSDTELPFEATMLTAKSGLALVTVSPEVLIWDPETVNSTLVLAGATVYVPVMDESGVTTRLAVPIPPLGFVTVTLADVAAVPVIVATVTCAVIWVVETKVTAPMESNSGLVVVTVAPVVNAPPAIVMVVVIPACTDVGVNVTVGFTMVVPAELADRTNVT